MRCSSGVFISSLMSARPPSAATIIPSCGFTGFFRKEEIKKGIMSSSQQRHVVIPFLISLLKNEGTEEPCYSPTFASPSPRARTHSAQACPPSRPCTRSCCCLYISRRCEFALRRVVYTVLLLPGTSAGFFTGLRGRFSVFAVQKHRYLRRSHKR